MIKSVEKALNILSFMIDEGTNGPISLSRIADACQLNQSTCSHLVDTLCANAFLERISRKDGYILGPMGYRASSRQYYRQELMESALPVMKKLSMRLCEDCTLSTYSHQKLFVPMTVYYHDDGCRFMKLQEGHLYRSAAGRVFMAHMESRQLQDLIARNGYPDLGHWRMSHLDEIDKILAEVRKKGYAAVDKVTGNLSGVACPIFAQGRLQAAVGIYMETERFEGQHLADTIEQTVLSAKSIGRRLENKLAEGDNVVYANSVLYAASAVGEI